MEFFPLAQGDREVLVDRLNMFIGPRDVLTVVQEKIFTVNRSEAIRVKYMSPGPQPLASCWDIVRYCELSAWARQPPLMVELLKSLEQAFPYTAELDEMKRAGPFRCHPAGEPFLVALVAAQMPMLGRYPTRFAAGNLFEALDNQAAQARDIARVLRINGPCGSGKTYTLRFFQYLSLIQPLKLGVIEFDFATTDAVTRAAAGEQIELHIARQLDEQVRTQRAVLQRNTTPGNDQFDVRSLAADRSRQPFAFSPLTDTQQRTRWTKDLVDALVDQVLFRPNQTPEYWVVVLDNCGAATPEAQEFVRRLVERAAGTNPATATAAAEGPLRVVLLGDSSAMLPNPVYTPHLYEENLSQPLGRAEVQDHFKLFAKCRDATLEPAQLERLTDTALKLADDLMAARNELACARTRVLAEAVSTTTGPLEESLAQKRGQA
jgi:hypothetical protein